MPYPVFLSSIDSQFVVQQSVVMLTVSLSIVMLCVILLSVDYAEFLIICSGVCHYAECRGAI